MNTMVMEITPRQAEEFLRLNSSNRPIRPSWVKRLTAIIERGEWMLTHQGIAITKENQLLDGQHRLKAIVASGKTVMMNVSFDCDPLSFSVLDGGVKRSLGDQLALPPGLVAVARLVWKLPTRTLNETPTSAQVLEVLGWSRDVLEEVRVIGASKTKRTSSHIQLPVAVHLMCGRTEVLSVFRAFRDLDFDAMPESVKALTKQVMAGTATARKDGWDLSARVWRTFDPAAWGNKKISIKDVGAACGEMQKAAEQFRRRRMIKIAA
jgi:hypothetical protein